MTELFECGKLKLIRTTDLKKIPDTACHRVYLFVTWGVQPPLFNGKDEMKYCIIFIVLDFIIGTGRSFVEGTWKSGHARTGLYKKASEIALIGFSIVLEQYLSENLNMTTNIYQLVCTYISGMEILSILENFTKNGDLSNIIDKIKSIVAKKEVSNSDVLSSDSERIKDSDK